MSLKRVACSDRAKADSRPRKKRQCQKHGFDGLHPRGPVSGLVGEVGERDQGKGNGCKNVVRPGREQPWKGVP